VDLDDLFPAELGDRRSAIRDHLDQPLRLEDSKHLAQRRAADLQLPAHIGLDQLLTRPELALHDRVAQPTDGITDDRHLTAGGPCCLRLVHLVGKRNHNIGVDVHR
jgi:hypothetical protein